MNVSVVFRKHRLQRFILETEECHVDTDVHLNSPHLMTCGACVSCSSLKNQTSRCGRDHILISSVTYGLERFFDFV